MAQISLYIQDSMADKLIAAAKARDYSVSKYVALIVSEKLNEEDEGEARKRRVLRDLRGAIKDSSFTEPPEISWEADTQRRFDLL